MNFEGKCARGSACNRMGATWRNHSTHRFYCFECAMLINQANPEFKRENGYELCTEGWNPPTWDAMKHLNGLHTRKLLDLRDVCQRHGYGRADVTEGFMVYHVTHDQIKEVLSTREHIPNKFEAKEIRRKKAHDKRHR